MCHNCYINLQEEDLEPLMNLLNGVSGLIALRHVGEGLLGLEKESVYKQQKGF